MMRVRIVLLCLRLWISFGCLVGCLGWLMGLRIGEEMESEDVEVSIVGRVSLVRVMFGGGSLLNGYRFGFVYSRVLIEIGVMIWGL